MPEESCDSRSNVLSGASDFAAEDLTSNRWYSNGRHPIDEEGAGDDHQWDVPEPERQENLLVDDVLGQDAEAVHLVKSTRWSNILHHAAYPFEKKNWFDKFMTYLVSNI